MKRIKEAATKYMLKRHKNCDNQRRFNENACEDDFIAGAKSQAAKYYWYEKFKQV